MDILYTLLVGGYVTLVGLFLGSFTTALVYRFEHHLPFAWDEKGRPVRSMCPPCGRTLRVRELIPVLSWVLQKGRCACGKAPIPWTYPATEIGVMTLILLLFSFYGLTWGFAVRAALVPFITARLILSVKRYTKSKQKRS